MLVGCGLIRKEDLYSAAESGFDYVEFMGKYLMAMSQKEFLDTVTEAEHLKMRCLGINGYCPKEIVMAGPGFDPKRAKEYARQLSERAEALKTKFVGIGSPNSRTLPEGYPAGKAEEELKDFLKITAEEFGRYGITVCLEALAPCYCNFINSVEESARIVRELGWDSIKTVLDFYNMEYVGEADRRPEDIIDSVVHAHISDDDGGPLKRSFLRAEKSEIHQRRIRMLYEAGYTGAVTIEVDVPADPKRAEESLRTVKDSVKGRKLNHE
ncbi:sugar phosphate isomerase/epimerase family protein [Hungatella hathewayi]|uniref:sugar phosphate isomerase/epimerase family protein n=1 Tax=Hungatella hathewayi TaxID=154046 RepID=UPI0035645469